MTYEEAVATIPLGRYRHFKGNEYEVIGIARHSEDESPMVVYRALYGDGGIWVRPASMWNETVERDGKSYRRFVPVNDIIRRYRMTCSGHITVYHITVQNSRENS